ncbi:type VI secretion system Vgr family protein [Cupriavidus malaysiensis]|uniref:Type IV secretion protein Rhs n=1 Tax=Cupriavidus malaysiensis TaxID=367825 RepID=A0ABN4TW65_9BURK|nr:type VI secretion system Vgr family protein [Cupriavidus malaysiensis]AOZ09950.1 type IV secretion protein Rhs [Cupriavidus malaysiensis]
MGNRSAHSPPNVKVSGPALPELLGQPTLVFSRLSGTDNLNALFEYELELRTPDERSPVFGPAANLDKKALQGTAVTVEIALDGAGVGLQGGIGAGKREITGLVTQVRGPYPVGRQIAYQLTLRPWLWLATLRSDYKIFQHKTVVEILDELLGNYIFPVEKRLDAGRYPKRVFQQQYGETDFDFFQRLTQEWGISWFIDHANGRQRLVLTDGNGAFQRIPSAAYHTIRWQPAADRIDEEHIHEFELIDRLVSGEWRAGDYDFVKPRGDLSVSSADPRDTAHATQSIYEYPGDHAQPTTGNDPWDEGRFIARIRMEELRQRGVRAKAKGNLRAIAPGRIFTLKNYIGREANRDYLIFATRLRLEDVGEASGTALRWQCEVEFEVQPANEIFRPVRTQPKPIMHGPLQARVTGPAGHPIHTDEYGRIKVQMPYDLYGSNDENSSCYLRVSDAWGGHRYGSTHLPRVGSEVLVEALNGDPDSLIVTCRVNNRQNLPPWNLPDQQAISGFRSEELPAADGTPGARHNKMLADDTAGEPQVQIGSDYRHSELALGHIVAIPGWEGRKEKRGEGFELRTDAWGAVRAESGLLISTCKRAGGHALSMAEMVDDLQRAEQQTAQLADAARKVDAQDGEQKDVADAIGRQHAALKGDGPLKELAAPHLALASPAGIVTSTPGLTHLQSGTHLAVTTGEHMSVTTHGGFFASIRKAWRVFVYEAGMRFVAAAGNIDIQALKDSINLLAKLEITATAERIRIKAKTELLLDGGTSYLKLTEGGIEHGTNGAWTVHAASKSLTGPSSLPVELQPKQVCLECLLKAALRNAAVVPR